MAATLPWKTDYLLEKLYGALTFRGSDSLMTLKILYKVVREFSLKNFNLIKSFKVNFHDLYFFSHHRNFQGK